MLNLEYLPAILINQDFILIDGDHRLKAHELNSHVSGETVEIESEIIQTSGDEEIKELAYKTNSNHGNQLSNSEKRKYAQDMISSNKKSIKELAKILWVKERTIRSWVDEQLRDSRKKRKAKILKLHEEGWTQASIADEVGITQPAVNRVIINNYKHVKSYNDILPPKLFQNNMWSANDGKKSKYFGSFSIDYLANLLYYHTNVGDLIYDPFAGSGSTAEACQMMHRRYFLSDRKVYPSREDEIIKHDITNGLPRKLPTDEISMCFCDPPYWRQSHDRYSKDDPECLGNMTLEQFNLTMNNFFTELKKAKIPKIAIVIQPTRYSHANLIYEDHILDFHEMLCDTYKCEMRYILRYPIPASFIYVLEKAKAEKEAWVIHRDLAVYKIKNRDS